MVKNKMEKIDLFLFHSLYACVETGVVLIQEYLMYYSITSRIIELSFIEHFSILVESSTESIDFPLHEAAKRGNVPFLQECLNNNVSKFITRSVLIR